MPTTPPPRRRPGVCHVLLTAPRAPFLVRCCLRCSGNIVIETSFFDGDVLVSQSKVRIFYV